MTNIIAEANSHIPNLVSSSNSICESTINGAGESIGVFVREWLAAIGGFLVVIVAILSEKIKSWFKARVELEISNHAPHFMVEGTAYSVLNTNDVIGKIWIEVNNKSTWRDAIFIRLAVEAIYVRVNSNEAKCFSKLHEMHPQYLGWSGLTKPKNTYLQISPKTSEYALVATIQLPQVGVANAILGSENPPELTASPIIVVACGRQLYQIQDDFQDIIVQIRLTANTVSTKTCYVQVTWKGRNIKQLVDGGGKFLSCKMLDHSKFQELIAVCEEK